MGFPNELLGSRVEKSWIEVLSYPDNQSLGIANHIDISSVQIDSNIDSRIMGGMRFEWRPGSLQVTELDWDQVLFRPWTQVNRYRWPWGVYLASSVSRQGRNRTVSGLDKTALLDQDAPSSTFTLQAGTNIIAAVELILNNRLRNEVPRIPASSKTTDVMMTWPAGTSYLTIVNNLLEKAYYTTLRVDGFGTFFALKNTDPAKSDPVHTFERGNLSIYETDPSDTQDFLSVPNQVICTTQGTDSSPGLLSVATNNLDDSQFSIKNRGRIISKTYENVEASDQATLDRIASRNLWNSSTPVRTIEVNHAKVPLLVGSVVSLVDDTSGFSRDKMVVNEYSVRLAEGELVSAKWNVVNEELGQLISTDDGASSDPVYTPIVDDDDSAVSSDDAVTGELGVDSTDTSEDT